ncbi:PREDICTED: zinc finger protein 148-like isoform X4 [Branchiostoma belcheri]|uniref:Zinc finger protein 148-like isoform X4 n=1 Tax=Branchiostoma belcheri TaxID=7741 RepID=A0A6P4Y6J9_BRABE|nr:PREDICTED: zinc finger protein 148-like isoform X4 [Branchiostoma belcheri]
MAEASEESIVLKIKQALLTKNRSGEGSEMPVEQPGTREILVQHGNGSAHGDASIFQVQTVEVPEPVQTETVIDPTDQLYETKEEQIQDVEISLQPEDIPQNEEVVVSQEDEEDDYLSVPLHDGRSPRARRHSSSSSEDSSDSRSESESESAEDMVIDQQSAPSTSKPRKRSMSTGTGERPHRCNRCKAAFKTSYHLRRHISTHTGEKPFQCEDCNKCFIQKYHLNRHLRVHSGDKPYQCSDCGASFARSDRLLRHKRQKHPGSELTLSERPFMKHSSKKFKCNYCKFSSVHKKDVEKHQKTHERRKGKKGPKLTAAVKASKGQTKGAAKRKRKQPKQIGRTTGDDSDSDSDGDTKAKRGKGVDDSPRFSPLKIKITTTKKGTKKVTSSRGRAAGKTSTRGQKRRRGGGRGRGGGRDSSDANVYSKKRRYLKAVEGNMAGVSLETGNLESDGKGEIIETIECVEISQETLIPSSEPTRPVATIPDLGNPGFSHSMGTGKPAAQGMPSLLQPFAAAMTTAGKGQFVSVQPPTGQKAQLHIQGDVAEIMSAPAGEVTSQITITTLHQGFPQQQHQQQQQQDFHFTNAGQGQVTGQGSSRTFPSTQPDFQQGPPPSYSYAVSQSSNQVEVPQQHIVKQEVVYPVQNPPPLQQPKMDTSTTVGEQIQFTTTMEYTNEQTQGGLNSRQPQVSLQPNQVTTSQQPQQQYTTTTISPQRVRVERMPTTSPVYGNRFSGVEISPSRPPPNSNAQQRLQFESFQGSLNNTAMPQQILQSEATSPTETNFPQYSVQTDSNQFQS